MTALDPDDLRAALDDADLRVLLMVLHQLTGDRSWLEAPYRPSRDVRLVADPGAGFPPEIQERIRRAAVDIIAAGGRPLITEPSADELVELMSVCLGEDVDPAYGPMMLEDMGIAPDRAEWRGAPPDLGGENVVVIGAGVAGIGLARACRRLGLPCTVIERNDGVGGTWLENRYPGAGVDTPNLFYSWSDRPNPGWTRWFSQRDELLGYLKQTVADEQLGDMIRLGTELRSARWDGHEQRWHLTIAGPDGVEHLSARFLVSAIGHISEPNDARFPGMERFDGPLFHSARWPDDLDLGGRNVAIVGTGATAMQLAPSIVDDVDHLTIYQRSPQWARPTPEYHQSVTPATRWLFEHVPGYATWYRFTLFWRYGDGLLRHLRRDPEWPHPERAMNRVNDRHRQQMTDHITSVLHDRPDLVDACVPSYPPYGKRILLDNGWFEMLRRADVELVTAPIVSFDERGIVDDAGNHRDHDVVVLATGFSIARLAARLDLTGRRGETLASRWGDDNPTAYLGITVPDFPNFFVAYGPNTNLGHGGSAFFNAECQTRYITKMMVATVEGPSAALEVTTDALDGWVDAVDAEHAELIWTHPGVTTWYRNRHGRVVSTSPFRLVDYWAMTHDADVERYHPPA